MDFIDADVFFYVPHLFKGVELLLSATRRNDVLVGFHADICKFCRLGVGSDVCVSIRRARCWRLCLCYTFRKEAPFNGPMHPSPGAVSGCASSSACCVRGYPRRAGKNQALSKVLFHYEDYLYSLYNAVGQVKPSEDAHRILHVGDGARRATWGSLYEGSRRPASSCSSPLSSG